MVHQIYIPNSPLNQFIAHFTYYKNYTPNHSIDRFLPNGNVEIVIDLTEEPKFIYDNELLTEIQACNKIWVSGTRTKYITIPSGKDSEMLIITFHKGMAFPFLNLPLSEITNQVVDGELILHKLYLDLREKLLTTPTLPQKFKLIEETLVNNFRTKMKINSVIKYAVDHIVLNPEVTTIKNVAQRVGYSSKHLINLFETNIGISPKAFLRVLRFQKAIQEIESPGSSNFSQLAFDCGFYDQSHFIADFKAFSGYTPAKYFNLRGEFLNYIPVK